jgi:lipid-A-disaccharide synthase
MTIYFVAGEASADNHGAALMSALRNKDVDLAFGGRGGPQMKAVAGAQFNNWIDKSGVLGLWEVVKHYGYFRQQFAETLAEITQSKPDAVVLIDYPGFNLRLARALHEKERAPKIIYYISPQVWAWNRGRITKMARWIDLMLCIFPFEPELYREAGLRAVFVGHPMIDRLRECKIDIERDPKLIALLPGSRLREVRKIFPVLIETTRELRKVKPDLRFEIAAASPRLAATMKEMGHRLAADDHRQDTTIKTGETAELMQRASVGIIASGSATLEAAYFGLPFVLVYKVAWPTYLAARLVVSVKYLGMPNVIAGRELVPEFIQHRARPDAIAQDVLRLINDKTARGRMISGFDAVIASLGAGGASDRAANAILNELG